MRRRVLNEWTERKLGGKHFHFLRHLFERDKKEFVMQKVALTRNKTMHNHCQNSNEFFNVSKKCIDLFVLIMHKRKRS